MISERLHPLHTMTATPVTTPPTDSTRPKKPWRVHVRAEVAQGRAAASLGWRLVRLRPALLLWRTVGVGLGEMLSTILWVMILGVMLLQVGVLDTGTTLSGVLGQVLALCTSPTFIVGALGCAASVTAITWFADAMSEAGVWEACAEELDPGLKTHDISPWRRATRHVAHIMVWQLLRRVMLIAGVLLFAGVYIGIIKVQMVQMHAVFKALTIASLYSAGLIYVALWVGIMAWYPAMAIAHESMHAGERLLHAAKRALMHPVAIYRLFLHVIAPVIPLFMLSFVLTLAQGFTLNAPELNSLVGAIAIFVDLITFVAVIAAGMAWRAGSICLEASWSGDFDAPQTVVARQRARTALGKSSAHSTFAHMGVPHPEQPEILDVQLAQLRPIHAPNVLPLSELLSPTHLKDVLDDEQDQAPEP